MIIAAAQTRPEQGNVEANLRDHYRFIEQASENGAGLIVFPEMSITGYERDRAFSLSFTRDDARLEKLTRLSEEKQITIVAGAPIQVNGGLYIGAFIIRPMHPVAIYTKQFLHPGEEVYYKSSPDNNPLIEVGNERVSMAICADINHLEHAENAGEVGTTLYVAGIFFEPHEMGRAHQTLSGYAKKYAMHVLMSNYVGETWGAKAGGQSGFWGKNGKCVAGLNGTDTGLLLVEKSNGIWKSKLAVYG